MATKARSMFMDTLRIEADKDLIHLGLMDYGPDGLRPEVDGETLSITLPLSQFHPLMDDLKEGFNVLAATGMPEDIAFVKSRYPDAFCIPDSSGPTGWYVYGHKDPKKPVAFLGASHLGEPQAWKDAADFLRRSIPESSPINPAAGPSPGPGSA